MFSATASINLKHFLKDNIIETLQLHHNREENNTFFKNLSFFFSQRDVLLLQELKQDSF